MPTSPSSVWSRIRVRMRAGQLTPNEERIGARNGTATSYASMSTILIASLLQRKVEQDLQFQAVGQCATDSEPPAEVPEVDTARRAWIAAQWQAGTVVAPVDTVW